MAGVELDDNSNPVIVDARPKWIRPVCNTQHGEVPDNIAVAIKLLDVLQLEVTGSKPEGFQVENVLFEQRSIRVIGTFDKKNWKIFARKTNIFLVHVFLLCQKRRFKTSPILNAD